MKTKPQPNLAQTLRETEVTLISEGTKLEGKISFDHVVRVHGVLTGEIHAKSGSTVVFGENAVIEGNVDADTLIVDGFVRGNIVARKRIEISRSGRVIGEIRSPQIKIEFGAHFEGRAISGPDSIA